LWHSSAASIRARSSFEARLWWSTSRSYQRLLNYNTLLWYGLVNTLLATSLPFERSRYVSFKGLCIFSFGRVL
jgi:hypothetical protein